MSGTTFFKVLFSISNTTSNIIGKQVISGDIRNNLAQSLVFNIKYQGAKIKEIRDLTGAQINVSQESLPDSNERTVEVKTFNLSTN